MVNFFIYAKDFSGSTNGISHYHSNGLKSLEQFKSDVEKIEKELLMKAEPETESKIIYLHWGNRCYEVDEATTVKTYKELSGDMGTKPVRIIQWIRSHYDICGENNKIKLLYIITDGLIDSASTKKCFDSNENVHYETVVFHAFNENLDQIDLSVAASFFKSRCIIYRNYELFDDADISEEFDYDKINIGNFAEEKDNLKSYIRLKFINKFKHDVIALHEIDKLKKLRDRLFVELSATSKQSKVFLDSTERNEFLREFVNTEWYKTIITADHDEKVKIDKAISTLINYIVNDKKSYSFDALKCESEFVNPVKEEPIVDVNFTAEQEIEFPDVILDDDKGIPVILLAEFSLLDKIIFHKTEASGVVSSASFNKFKSVMECPLFLLNDPDISESIGYFYTLNVYKELLKNTTRTDPRTRRPFHGGLVLTDSDQFDKYNDYILAATYFNFCEVHYNIGLFYYVLLKNCENKEWMDRNVVEQFKKYVIRRISATVCKVGLSSLPLDPPMYTSLPMALRYCVELSSCIFKDDPKNFMHERLRMFYGVAPCMIEILNYFNYDIDINSIKKRCDLIRHVMILKRIPIRSEKFYYLLEKIFKTVNGFLVCEIENALNLNKLNYLKFDHKSMLCDDVGNEKVNLYNYVLLLHHHSSKSVRICEKTFRPFFTIDHNKSFYPELVKVTKKVVISNDEEDIKITYETIDSLEFDKMLSLYNLFIRCVKDLKKYPTLSEYVEYISKKRKYTHGLVTIFPPNVYSDIERIYSCYQKVISSVDVKTFIEVTRSYVKRSDRIKAEEVVNFKNDGEINDFISNEELKVKFKSKTIISQSVMTREEQKIKLLSYFFKLPK